MRSTLLGIDFSGAALAGEKIWVSRAVIEKGALHFDFLERASNLPEGAPERETALTALLTWIKSQQGARCGFDFPFSLVREAIPDASYGAWLKNFSTRYPTAEDLKSCGYGEKRATDIAAKTPFSPLNLRLYRQTYYGIRDVLAPLYESGACILPFDEPDPHHTWLLEICPASLLKREKLYLSYKGKSAAQRLNRETIAQEMGSRTLFSWDERLKEKALGDPEGDALDAVLSAICVFNALQKADELKAHSETDLFEGKVYF
jgi:hypothetical protein